MNIETKVGLFVFIGLMIGIFGIMKLSDIRFESRYKLYFIFDDVKGLHNKSPVKIAGVEIGRVDQISLEKGKAKITAKIRKDVPIYANGSVRVKITGIIGSQFLDVDPGTPEFSRLQEGDILYGRVGKSLEDIMEKISELVEGKDGEDGLGLNLRATMKNMHSISDSLNQAIGLQSAQLKDMVENFHQFSADLKGLASDLHSVTASKKEDIEAVITRLRSLLERLDDIVERVQRGEGSVGKLLADREMGEAVKKTVSNLRDTSESAKQVLGRFTKIRSFWEFEVRSVPGAGTLRGDGGIRLQPKEHKYYYFGINNAGNRKDEYKNAGDYEKKNTITAVLGKEFGPVTVELGAIRSSAGVGLKYYPFENLVSEKSPNRWMRSIELNSQAFDFARNEIHGKANQQRKFRSPQINLGAKYKINRWVSLGASVEDMSETRQYNMNTHLMFEDRDLAYLFGFVSFAR